MSKIISSLLGVCALLSVAFGTFFYIDSRYALAETVKQIQKRFDYKMTTDEFNATKSRLYHLEEIYPQAAQMPKPVREEYRELQDKKESLKEELKSMEKK